MVGIDTRFPLDHPPLKRKLVCLKHHLQSLCYVRYNYDVDLVFHALI